MTDDPAIYTELDQGLSRRIATSIHQLGRICRGYIHTNTVEGFFSIFKRGMPGVYQFCARNTCTATSPSSISATATAERSAA